MSKFIKIPFGEYYYKKFSSPVRNRMDILYLILDTINLLSFDCIEENQKGKLIIKVDKMSRIFIYLDEKYFSFIFPFSLEEKDMGKYYIYDNTLDLEIDNKIISLLRSMLRKIDYASQSLEEILESIYYDSMDEEYSSFDMDSGWRIIMKLLTAEPGYIRCDFDMERQNGRIHPLNHLDINYSTGCSYKLGLKKRWDLQEFIDMLDISTECRYVL